MTVKCQACGAIIPASLASSPCPRLTRLSDSAVEFVVALEANYQKFIYAIDRTTEAMQSLASAYAKPVQS
jgi:hypothetical protein